MHCFEGPQWVHLKKGRESFARGPFIKVDPLGRCAGVLVYGLQMIILKAAEVYSATLYIIAVDFISDPSKLISFLLFWMLGWWFGGR